MKKIPLSNSSRVAIVDDGDFDKVSQFTWRELQQRPGGTCRYAISCSKTKGILMHRLILNGHPQIDHRDGDGLNNRRGNLRPCNHTQNQANSRKRFGTTSRYKGVSKYTDCQKWRARIKLNGRLIHIGSFDHEQEAAIAYNIAASELFGNFARLNAI